MNRDEINKYLNIIEKNIENIRDCIKNDTLPHSLIETQSFVSYEPYTKEELRLIKEYMITGRNLTEIGFKCHMDDTETIVVQRI